jgi:hypothetical protein
MKPAGPRCQAILLTPETRHWAKRHELEFRCKWTAKPESPFCGVHAGLGLIISEIVWKDPVD